MKFSNRNKLTLFLLFSVFFNPLITAGNNEENVQEEQLLSKEQQNELAKLIEKEQKSAQWESLKNGIKDQLQKIEYILQHIADMLNNNNLKNVNKSTIIEHISNLKMDLATIKQAIDSNFSIDPQMIATLNFLIKQYINHISQLVKSGLQNIPMPNREVPTVSENPLLEEEVQHIVKNTQALTALEVSTKNIGLNLFNRFYRKIEHINKQYKVLPRLGKTMIAGLGVCLLTLVVEKKTWTKVGNALDKIPGVQLTKNAWNGLLNFFEKSPIGSNYIKKITQSDILRKPSSKLSAFKDSIGDMPTYIGGGNEASNADKLTSWGQFVHNFGPRNLNLVNPYLPAALIGWPLFGSYIKTAATTAVAKVKKTCVNIHNKLRGGSIAQKLTLDKEPRFTLNDVIGNEHIKQKLIPFIGYHCESEIYEQAGIAPQPGIIFAGSSSAGKSYLAEAVAGEIIARRLSMGMTEKFTFLPLSAGDVMNREFFPNGIQDVIELAHYMAPCILFIDEIDMGGYQREQDRGETAKLLTILSGVFSDNKNVTIIGATTQPDHIDSALINNRRFEIMQLGYPSFNERREFLLRECQKRTILVEEDYINKLAHETKGHPYDTLLKIIKVASQNAKIQRSSVTQKHLEQAFDERIRKIQNNPPAIPTKQKQVVAAHQAGHALATMLLDTHKQLEKVTINLVEQNIEERAAWNRFEDQKNDEKGKIKADYGKIFTHTDHELEMSTREDLLNDCRIAVAGHIAETILLGSCAFTYHDHDQDEAMSLAKYLMFEGTYEKLIPKEEREELKVKARALVKKCKEEMIQLLTKHKDKLNTIAEALEKHNTLSGKDIEALLSKESQDEVVAEENSHGA